MGYSADAGKLVLRLALGVMLLLHGIAKVRSGVPGIVSLVAGTGMPEWIGYLVYVGEVAAPVLLIVGLWTRLAALVVVINMLVAILLAHPSQLASLGRSGGWALELQGFYLFTAVAVALLGAGRFSAGGSEGRLN